MIQDEIGGRPPELSVDSLGTLDLVAQGGVGALLRPAAMPGLLLKRYRDPGAYESRSKELILLRERFAPGCAPYLQRHFSWPQALVKDNEGGFLGTLVPEVPRDYFAVLATGRTRGRDLGFLIYERRAQRVGVQPIDYSRKAAVLASLAEVCLFLEDRGLIHEDVSPPNVLWVADETGSALLIDCDSIRTPLENPSPPLALQPDWVDPRWLMGEVARPDSGSVSYVLGLLVVRVLADPAWRPPAGDLGTQSRSLQNSIHDSRLLEVVIAALANSLPRPRLSEWVSVLEASARRPSRPPGKRRATVTGAVVGAPTFDAVSYQTKAYAALLVGAALGCTTAILLLLLLLVA